MWKAKTDIEIFQRIMFESFNPDEPKEPVTRFVKIITDPGKTGNEENEDRQNYADCIESSGCLDKFYFETTV